jgi:fatty acid desaturase
MSAQRLPGSKTRRADDGKPRTPINWERANIWFLRALAIAWIAQGLQAWATILGVDLVAAQPFEARPMTEQAVTVYFAVIDLLAAVGLWLLAPWGGVVWLLAVVSKLVLGFVFPAASDIGLSGAAAFGACILAFMGLNWMAGRAAAR